MEFDRQLPRQIKAEFTAVVQGPYCTIIMISATDFVRSFKNCIPKLKEIYLAKQVQAQGRQQ